MIADLLHRVREIDIVYQYIAIFVIAFIPFLEAHVAVPVGILLGLPVIPTIALGLAANLLSVIIVVTGTSAIRSKVSANMNSADPFRNKRFQRAQGYFHSYGVPGLSLIGPIIGANHIGAFVCVLANADKRRVMLWQTISVAVWAIGTGLLMMLGVDLYNSGI